MNNHRTAAMILVGMSIPLMAQDCQPQTKTQKAVSGLNLPGSPVMAAYDAEQRVTTFFVDGKMV